MEIEEKILKIMSLALYIESESETASVIVRYSSYHGLFQTEICIDCPDETTDKIYNVMMMMLQKSLTSSSDGLKKSLQKSAEEMPIMKVLVACEESQRVCTAFRELGHEAYSCDIQECSGGHPEWHILGDVLPLINGNCEFATMDGFTHKIDGKWDLLIAHPPCTYLSNAGACRLYPKKGQLNKERYQKGLKAKDFFMSLYNANCERICVENPIPSKIYELPAYTQIIQPFEYGHPYSKKNLFVA